MLKGREIDGTDSASVVTVDCPKVISNRSDLCLFVGDGLEQSVELERVRNLR
jgi:hypothetical protein